MNLSPELQDEFDKYFEEYVSGKCHFADSSFKMIEYIGKKLPDVDREVFLKETVLPFVMSAYENPDRLGDASNVLFNMMHITKGLSKQDGLAFVRETVLPFVTQTYQNKELVGRDAVTGMDFIRFILPAEEKEDFFQNTLLPTFTHEVAHSTDKYDLHHVMLDRMKIRSESEWRDVDYIKNVLYPLLDDAIKSGRAALSIVNAMDAIASHTYEEPDRLDFIENKYMPFLMDAYQRYELKGQDVVGGMRSISCLLTGAKQEDFNKNIFIPTLTREANSYSNYFLTDAATDMIYIGRELPYEKFATFAKDQVYPFLDQAINSGYLPHVILPRMWQILISLPENDVAEFARDKLNPYLMEADKSGVLVGKEAKRWVDQINEFLKKNGDSLSKKMNGVAAGPEGESLEKNIKEKSPPSPPPPPPSGMAYH